MATRNLTAETRKENGKAENGRLRKTGSIPCVLNWHGKSENIKLKEKDFLSIFKGGSISESVLIDLDVKGSEKCQVFVKDFQSHPVTDEILHVDFYKITAGEKIHTIVPVELKGFAVGQKKGGIVSIVEHQLSVHILPAELPEKFEIDVTNLDVNDAVRIKDIKAPASAVFAFDPEHIVVHVVLPKQEQEESAEGAATSAEGTAGA